MQFSLTQKIGMGAKKTPYKNLSRNRQCIPLKESEHRVEPIELHGMSCPPKKTFKKSVLLKSLGSTVLYKEIAFS